MERRTLLKSALGISAVSIATMMAEVPAHANMVPAETMTVLNDSMVFTMDPVFTLRSGVSTYTWRVRNWKDEEVASGSGQGTRLAIPKLEDGFYRLLISTSLGDTPDIPFIVTRTKWGPSDFWSVSANFSNGTALEKFDPVKNLSDIAKIGAGTVRETVLWQEFEKHATLGTYKFTDRLNWYLDPMRANGLNLAFTASNTHGAYGKWRSLDSDSMQVAWANYINAVLDQRPDIKCVELYNEFNGGFNNGDRSPENYARICKRVYPIIKAKHPQVEVIAGATSGIANDFAKRFFQAGGFDYMDSWSFHPYAEEGDHILNVLELFRGYMRDNSGGRTKPFRITEFGWSLVSLENVRSNQGNNSKVTTERYQASNLTEIMLALHCAPDVKQANWYNAIATESKDVSMGLDVKATEGGFGLFDWPTAHIPNAYPPRESAWAFSVARQQMEGTVFKNRKVLPLLGRERGLDLVTLDRNGQTVYALYGITGWPNGRYGWTDFVDNYPIKELTGKDGRWYYKAIDVMGTATYGYGYTIKTNRRMQFVTFSKTPFKDDPSNYRTWGAIESYWRKNGGESVFGAPSSSQSGGLAHGGYIQHFGNKHTFYWHQNTQVGVIYKPGAIGQHFFATGEENGLGYPLGQEKAESNYWYQCFQGATNGVKTCLTFSPQSGIIPIALGSGIGSKWWQMKASWGAPRSREIGIPGGVKQVFQNAHGKRNTVYWSSATGAWPIYEPGAIAVEFNRRGRESFGFPISGEKWEGHFVVQYFKKGSVTRKISWNSLSGRVTVS